MDRKIITFEQIIMNGDDNFINVINNVRSRDQNQ